MSGGTTVRLEPHEIALLRGGPRAAVTVAVVALHLRGAVEGGRQGTIRAWGAVAEERLASAPPLPPLAHAVLASLDEPVGIRQLVKQPDVRVALAEMRVGLAEAGLLRYPLLGPTRAARRHVRALGEQHPVPTSRRGLSEQDKLLAVALHGEAALRVLVPRFALQAGLRPRVDVADKGLLRHRPRGGPGGSGGAAGAAGSGIHYGNCSSGGGCGGGGSY